MNHVMKEKPGNIKDLSSANSRTALFWKTVFFCLTRPLCLVFWGITWFHLYSLCQFGRLHKNIPVLAVCVLWWFGALLYGVRLWKSYCRKAEPAVYDTIKGQGEKKTDAEESGEEAVSADFIRWVWKTRYYCQFFLKDKRVFLLDIRGLCKEDRDYLELKLSTVQMTGKRAWQMAAGIFVAAVTLTGVFLVGRSAVPYQGKLSWAIHDLQTKRTIALAHDNIYKTGIDGILRDVREKVELPEKLSLATSFNLHFSPDGKIQSLDTMLYGFDENNNFIDSYLITYQADRSEKVTVCLGGAENAEYDADKDLMPLVEAVSAMPLEETTAQWEGKDCYGILYYGIREWNSREGICLLNHSGECREPMDGEHYFCGYTISVFCPENKMITPVRYLYLGYLVFPEKTDALEEDASGDAASEGGVACDVVPEDLVSGDAASEGGVACDVVPEDLVSADAEASANVTATGNLWHVCNDYPLEEYGALRETEDTYLDCNGEIIYTYSYQDFQMEESLPAAKIVNSFLNEKQEETIAAWKQKGKYFSENATRENDYEWGNNPNDTMILEKITYLDEYYCSLVFSEYEYTGGAHGLPTCSAYTINLHDGTLVKLDQLSDQTRGAWIGQINQAFEAVQGFFVLGRRTDGQRTDDYAKTAGEIWYDSYDEGEWGSGFYLEERGVVIYYGFGQISWLGNGTIEVLIPWEQFNGE